MIIRNIERIPKEVRMGERRGRTINRVLIVLAVAMLLAGLLLLQWDQVLLNATLLCLSCIGLG